MIRGRLVSVGDGVVLTAIDNETWVDYTGCGVAAFDPKKEFLRLDRENPCRVVPHQTALLSGGGVEGPVDLGSPVIFVRVQLTGISGVMPPGMVANHPPAIDQGVLQPSDNVESPWV